jgi:hypothetical protein
MVAEMSPAQRQFPIGYDAGSIRMKSVHAVLRFSSPKKVRRSSQRASSAHRTEQLPDRVSACFKEGSTIMGAV